MKDLGGLIRLVQWRVDEKRRELGQVQRDLDECNQALIDLGEELKREQEAARLRAFNIGVGATMADISAQNLQATAGTIYPGLALGTSLLGSATDIATTWARNRRIELVVYPDLAAAGAAPSEDDTAQPGRAGE